MRTRPAAAARRTPASGRGGPPDGPRFVGAAADGGDHWIAEVERKNQAEGRRPIKAEAEGEAALAGVTVYGRADRIDRLPDGGLAIIDYKTGQPPSHKAVNEGFALQLGLLGLIGRAGGFEGVSGDPEPFEYWSLARYRGQFGRLMRPDKDMAEGEFLAHAYAQFRRGGGQMADRQRAVHGQAQPCLRALRRL